MFMHVFHAILIQYVCATRAPSASPAWYLKRDKFTDSMVNAHAKETSMNQRLEGLICIIYIFIQSWECEIHKLAEFIATRIRILTKSAYWRDEHIQGVEKNNW